MCTIIEITTWECALDMFAPQATEGKAKPKRLLSIHTFINDPTITVSQKKTC